jgi:hypothetical protein
MRSAELAIRDAMIEVEKLPADTRLTDAVVLLEKAQSKVADYIDGVEALETRPAAEVETRG